MHTSRIIEVDGVFIGAAILLPSGQGWRFVSADVRARGADGNVAPTLREARALARRAFQIGRLHGPAVLEDDHLPDPLPVRQAIKPFIDVIQAQPVRQ
jgi:hypothetical protein